TQDLYYYVTYARATRSRPRLEALEVWVSFVAMYALVAWAVVAGYGLEVLVLWLVPSRLAIAFLAWGFDYLPHRPHDTPAREDRFAATHIIGNWWLTPLFLYQNY